MSYFGRWTNTNFSTGTGGVHFSRRQTNNQKAAVIAHASDITLRLRQRARTSMFISLETGHFAWDSNNLFFIFIFQFLVGPVFFFHETISRKVDPQLRLYRFDQCGRPMLLQPTPHDAAIPVSTFSRKLEVLGTKMDLCICH